MPFEQKGQTATLTTDDPRRFKGSVTIPRVQYDALMAVAKALIGCHAQCVARHDAEGSGSTEKAEINAGYQAIAALRAAGIHNEEEGKT